MIKTVKATFECDVCQKRALNACEGGVRRPHGWLRADIEVLMCVVDAPDRAASAFNDHVCSVACLAKLFETKILDQLNNQSPTNPQDSNAESIHVEKPKER